MYTIMIKIVNATPSDSESFADSLMTGSTADVREIEKYQSEVTDQPEPNERLSVNSVKVEETEETKEIKPLLQLLERGNMANAIITTLLRKSSDNTGDTNQRLVANAKLLDEIEEDIRQ